MSETAAVVSPALALLKAAGYLVFRNNSGRMGPRHTQFGLGVGSADIIGLLKSGRFFAIECKKANATVRDVSDEQVDWGQAVMRSNGYWGVVSSPKQAIDMVLRWDRMEVANG